MSKLLTTAEVAERLGVTRWRVNALISDKRLRATKIGQIYVVEERDLEPVMVRKPGRPPKQATAAPQTEGAAKTSQKLNQAFRKATEGEQSGKKKGGKK